MKKPSDSPLPHPIPVPPADEQKAIDALQLAQQAATKHQCNDTEVSEKTLDLHSAAFDAAADVKDAKERTYLMTRVLGSLYNLGQEDTLHFKALVKTLPKEVRGSWSGPAYSERARRTRFVKAQPTQG